MSSGTSRPMGVTPSERYLKKLCDKTFLSLWSHVNVYKKPGKELCDLLVVFENHVIIFSDKHCAFPDTGDTEKDWKKWFRRAVNDSAKQAWGAERWIKQCPQRLFIDRRCTTPYPYTLPDSANIKFHLVVIAHDGARRCKEELGGSGSFMIHSDIIGVENHTPPFTLGDLDPNKSFVHVLDDTSLDILMSARNTISDFVDYLSKKEQLIRHGRPLIAAGEEELLAHFLKKVNDKEEHDFIFPDDVNMVALGEGHWEEFKTNPQRIAQLNADKISYSWDKLIEEFSYHAREGTQAFSSPAGLQTSERVMRFLAREPRVRRRMLAKGLIEFMQEVPQDQMMARYILPSYPGDPYYVFLLLPMSSKLTYDEYREQRHGFLEMYCRITKLRNPDAQNIVGIATESGIDNGGRSEDAMYLDASKWTEEDNNLAAEILTRLKLPLKLSTPTLSREEEYPDINIINLNPKLSMPKNPRNKPCPCGSKSKYKKCHGA